MDEGRGDFTTSVCLTKAKVLHCSPKVIAEELAQFLCAVEGVVSVDVAGAGFVNVSVQPSALFEDLSLITTVIQPKTPRGDAPILIDYSAPNIAKPLGIHHILSTVIGQVLANFYRHAGHTVVAINHIGDYGTQFGKLFVAYQRFGQKDVSECLLDDLLALYVRFHEEVEREPTLEDEGRKAFALLEQGDETLRAFWRVVVQCTMASMESVYKRLSVHFDETIGESFYEQLMPPIIEEGKKSGVFHDGKEGALIATFADDAFPPAVIVKGDGSTLYITRDLATIRYRIDRWQPQSILYVVDIAQQLHFQQLFETSRMLGWQLPHLEHVLFGRMRFADGSMSTRKGNIIKLEDALDEAVSRAEKLIAERGENIQTDDPQDLAEMMGVGALVYGIVSQNRKMDLVFDWEKMLSFDGNSAPYVQYTYARARSVLRKAEVDEVSPSSCSPTSLTTSEQKLLKTLLRFEDAFSEALSEHLPHKMTVYLYELCQAFNSFYTHNPILSASDIDLQKMRLSLTSLTAQVLKTGAELLTLRVPERM